MGQDERKNCKLKNRAAEKERGEREPGSKLRSWKNGLDKVIETKKDKSKKEGRAEEKVKERQRLDKRDKWRSRREEDSQICLTAVSLHSLTADYNYWFSVCLCHHLLSFPPPSRALSLIPSPFSPL